MLPLNHSGDQDILMLQHLKKYIIEDSGGPVVIILATGPEVRGFKPGLGRWIFSEIKNREYDFLRKRIKPWVPYRIFTACKRTSSRN